MRRFSKTWPMRFSAHKWYIKDLNEPLLLEATGASGSSPDTEYVSTILVQTEDFIHTCAKHV